VLSLLRAMAEVVGKYAPPEEAEAEATATGDGEAAGEPGASGAPRAAGTGGRSREDLLRQLVEIADFFKKTEPNSPLAYTLQDAVRRARMTWPELLAEIVPDEASRLAILTSLGIKPPEPPA
jgi:type VI secretion system protein ImpA